ncbi:hypothetical protein NDK43_27440 [Neobacillus pocheonensis]|uniref:Uncharacterized protein n=1 Tax=Neobacillus pocheonensis TaxID=363869 RepID=A0ABT0WDC0_9BACI|nr:hypothetical protein [Neobacillus pocheonensis]MCM2535391.1 hypothetical protein [Neobacillus pocheonensis]
MISISINEFAKSYVKNNKSEDLQEIKKKLKSAAENKRAGAVCITCDSPIWAIGSAIVEWNGCFTCITGESDSSEDYEIVEVNF